MFKRLSNIFGSSASEPVFKPATIETVLTPEHPFFAVGDIHGCLEKMQALITKLRAMDGDCPIVFLGDYIDRGSASAEVLKTLFDLNSSDPDRTICIMGNHEQMMLDFIDDPIGRGAKWLSFGGKETLDSFGIHKVKSKLSAEEAMDVADALEAAMPAGLQTWLRALPKRWSSGNMHCVHAGMNPSAAIDHQADRHLLWGHRDFFETPREDGQTVVFGHVIVSAPDIRDGRIAIDTGAYKTGTLTAAHIQPGSCEFLS